MSKIVFTNNDSSLEFAYNPWDSSPLDRSCYELSVSLGTMPARPETILKFMHKNKFDTVTCRVSSSDLALRSYLQSLGFFHVELQLKCRLALASNLAPKRQLGTLRLAQDKDRKRVQDIARNIFLASRFQYIPDLPPEKIGNRFSNWVNQLHDECPEFAYVLEVNETVMGFFYSKPTQNDHELYAALGGIAHDCRGPYGIYLYPAIMAAYYSSGIKNIISAIAADNMGALNLWASLGTKFPEATDIFMWNCEHQSTL